MSDTLRARIDVAKLWAEVKNNRAARASCLPHHTFPRLEARKAGDKVTCTRCGAWLSLGDALSYLEGWRHAGKDPEAVWPGATP